MGLKDVADKVTGTVQSPTAKRVKEELARLDSQYKDSIGKLSSDMNRSISQATDPTQKQTLITQRNNLIRQLFTNVLYGMQSLKAEVYNSSVGAGQKKKLLDSIDAAHGDFMATVKGYKVYNAAGVLTPVVDQSFINGWSELRGPTPNAPRSAVPSVWNGGVDVVGKDVTPTELDRVTATQDDLHLKGVFDNQRKDILNNSAVGNFAVPPTIESSYGPPVVHTPDPAASADSRTPPADVPVAVGGTGAVAPAQPTNTYEGLTAQQAAAQAYEDAQRRQRYQALLNNWASTVVTGVSGLAPTGNLQSPESAAIADRQAELVRRRAEQIAEADRAKAIYNRPEQVQAGVDMAAAQQAAAAAARAEVGGAGGAGAAAQAGAEAAYKAGVQAYPQLLQNARQLRYQYEQEDVNRRNAASETGADISAARQTQVAKNKEWSDRLTHDKRTRAMQAQAGAVANSDVDSRAFADNAYQAFLRAMVTNIQSGKYDSSADASGMSGRSSMVMWKDGVMNEAVTQQWVDKYGANKVWGDIQRLLGNKAAAPGGLSANTAIGAQGARVAADEARQAEDTANAAAATVDPVPPEDQAPASPPVTDDAEFIRRLRIKGSTTRVEATQWAEYNLRDNHPDMIPVFMTWYDKISAKNPAALAAWRAMSTGGSNSWETILRMAKAGTLQLPPAK
jgi:hypothetical protein